MLFATLFVQALVAAGTLAAPFTDKKSQSHITRREEFIRRVAPPGGSRVPFPTSNWAGAVITDRTAKWKSVAVPRWGLRGAYISIWVGVDGYTCHSATIKSGLDIEVNATGAVSYTRTTTQGHHFTTFSAGNNISLMAIANNFNEQDAVIQYLSKVSTFMFTFNLGPVLCQADAIWGIEAWQAGDARVPFTVEFTHAMATRLDGTVVGPGNATVINTEENGAVLSSCSTTESTVSCSFPLP
ncbi:peptidase A4 family-domain-containing protein [Mycena rebaudengoi]|nr:peptidase A4 family-domain-containing protein [Mycena rebaudengoi]